MNLLEKRFTLALAKDWWVVLLRGVIGILFGITLFAMPMMSVLVLMIMFAFVLIFDGILGVYMGISSRKSVDEWWVLLASGILGLILGVMTIFYPGATAMALLVLVAFWAISVGVFEVIAAIKIRKEIDGEWLIILSGILSIMVGVFLLARPLSGMVALVWVGAFFAIFYGTLLVVASFKLKKFKDENSPVDVEIKEEI